jgi:hypothetical protein
MGLAYNPLKLGEGEPEVLWPLEYDKLKWPLGNVLTGKSADELVDVILRRFKDKLS